jgi:hypothetical protein
MQREDIYLRRDLQIMHPLKYYSKTYTLLVSFN